MLLSFPFTIAVTGLVAFLFAGSLDKAHALEKYGRPLPSLGDEDENGRDAEETLFGGYFLTSAFVSNPTFAARPDNTGLVGLPNLRNWIGLWDWPFGGRIRNWRSIGSRTNPWTAAVSSRSISRCSCGFPSTSQKEIWELARPAPRQVNEATGGPRSTGGQPPGRAAV